MASSPPTLSDTVERLQRAEEEVRRLQDELIDAAAERRAETLAAIREAVVEGLGEGDGVEASIALVPLAEVLGELDGPEVCDLLVDVLGSDSPEVRFVAGRALQELAFERLKEVSEAIERAPKRVAATSHALRELPYVVAEVPEAAAPRILRGYLEHADGEVVAAAIEALASIGDPASVQHLRKLANDPRTVQIEDDNGEAQATIGLLAQEAVSMIESAWPEFSPAPAPATKGGRGGGRKR